jgi:hypothetical protein
LTGVLAPLSRRDLIDLLLDADELTRRLILFRALQTGALKKSEAEEVVDQMFWIERAADPRRLTTQAQSRV